MRRPSRRTRLCAATLHLILASCTGPTPDQAAVSPIELPAGIDTLSLVSETSWGRETDHEFTRIQGFAVDDAEQLYVTDLADASVKVFSPEGTFLRRIGTRGEGPGEMRVAGLIAVGNDSVFVRDAMGVLHIFHADGRFLNLLRAGSPLARAQQMFHTRQGLVLVSWGRVVGQTVDRSAMYISVLDYKANVVRERARLPLPQQHRQPWGYTSAIGAAVPYVGVAEDGTLYVSSGDSYTIVELGEQGDTTGVYSAPTDRVPVNADDEDEAFRALILAAEAAGGPPPDRRTYDPPRTKFRPVIGQVLAGPRGELLVRRRDLLGGYASGAPVAWDLIAPDWRVVGRLFTGPEVGLGILRGCRVYGVTTDQDGVQTIVRFRVDPCPLPPVPEDGPRVGDTASLDGARFCTGLLATA